MFLQALIFGFGYLISNAQTLNCPNGGNIFENGISVNGRISVVNRHNEIRLKAARGEIPGQPRGINIKKMIYDDNLELLARNVSVGCELKTSSLSDERYGQVGQNIYAKRSPSRIGEEDWSLPVNSWFDGHSNFVYANLSRSSGGRSYTQIVWASSYLIGCDYIQYQDPSQPDYPFTELYTCLYAPAGNVIGKAPYQTGTSGCENLC